jgi:hypothetical protein
MVVHAYNPSYSGSIGKRIIVSGWHGQKHETLSKNKLRQKMGNQRGHASSGKTLALARVRPLSSNLRTTKMKKKKKKKKEKEERKQAKTSKPLCFSLPHIH